MAITDTVRDIPTRPATATATATGRAIPMSLIGNSVVATEGLIKTYQINEACIIIFTTAHMASEYTRAFRRWFRRQDVANANKRECKVCCGYSPEIAWSCCHVRGPSRN